MTVILIFFSASQGAMAEMESVACANQDKREPCPSDTVNLLQSGQSLGKQIAATDEKIAQPNREALFLRYFKDAHTEGSPTMQLENLDVELNEASENLDEAQNHLESLKSDLLAKNNLVACGTIQIADCDGDKIFEMGLFPLTKELGTMESNYLMADGSKGYQEKLLSGNLSLAEREAAEKKRQQAVTNKITSGTRKEHLIQTIQALEQARARKDNSVFRWPEFANVLDDLQTEQAALTARVIEKQNKILEFKSALENLKNKRIDLLKRNSSNGTNRDLTKDTNPQKVVTQLESEILAMPGSFLTRQTRERRLVCGMSMAEHLAINWYARGGYKIINRELRRADSASALNRPELRAWVEVMNSGLEKLVPYSGILSRGANLPSRARAQYVANETVVEKAYLSTSRQGGFAMRTDIFSIQATGANCFWIDPVVQNEQEDEVVCRPGTPFLVKSASSGRYSLIEQLP